MTADCADGRRCKKEIGKVGGGMNQYWVEREDGDWNHRPPVKVIINTILRFFQLRWTNRPLLLVSVSEIVNGKPNSQNTTGLTGYTR